MPEFRVYIRQQVTNPYIQCLERDIELKLERRRKIRRYLGYLSLEKMRLSLWAKLQGKAPECKHDGYYISSKNDRYGSNSIPWINAITMAEITKKPLYHSCSNKCYRFKDTVMHQFLLEKSKPAKYCQPCNLVNRPGWLSSHVNELIDITNGQALPEVMKSSGIKDELFLFYQKRAEGEGWALDFVPDNTVIIHVRLDDMTFRTTENKQEFIGEDNLLKLIKKLNEKYPGHHLRLVTSPVKEDIALCIKIAKLSGVAAISVCGNDDLDYDLYQMMCCDVLILSRSTFSFIPALLHQGKEVYSYEKWKHLDELLGVFHPNSRGESLSQLIKTLD